MKALSVCVLPNFVRAIVGLRGIFACRVRARAALAVIVVTLGLSIPISSPVAAPEQRVEMGVAIFVFEVGEAADVTTKIILTDPSNMGKELQAFLSKTADQAQNTTKFILFGAPVEGDAGFVSNDYIQNLKPGPMGRIPTVNLYDYVATANKSSVHFFVGAPSNEQFEVLAKEIAICCSELGSHLPKQDLNAHNLYINNLQSTYDKFKWPAGLSTVGGGVVAGCSASNLICQRMAMKVISSVLPVKQQGH